MDTGIYQIQNNVTGCRYIGSAVSIGKRWREHRRTLDSGKHHSSHMKRSWANHGEAAFKFSILLYCNRENLLMYEQRFLDAYKPEYNSAPVAGSMLGYKHKPESRRRMSESNSRIGNPGYKHTDESKRKISQNRMGKGGGERSPERLAKISQALKGRAVSPEKRARISQKLMGHKQSPEQIEKRMQKIRGRKMPEGFAEAARQRMLGHQPTEETKLKLARSKSKHSEVVIREVLDLLSKKFKHREIERVTGVGRGTVADVSCGRKYGWVSL